jgi:SAM-dependent methyltransferase
MALVLKRDVKENLVGSLNKKSLFSHRNIGELKGLEIGALTSPLVVREDLKIGGEIYYLDHLSTDDLIKKYADDATVKKGDIVKVNFICPDGDIVKATCQHKFDYVIASHVIEHSPNPLKFLADIHKILKPGGLLYLVVPDKRFTFDICRPETTFGALLEAFLSNQNKPSVAPVYDHFSYAAKVDAFHIWSGLNDYSKIKSLTPASLAWEAANSVGETEEYFDVHVSIFTPFSFFEIIKSAITHGLFSFEVENFEDTAIGQLDFSVALTKSSADRSYCLSTIPKIDFETLFSPYMPQVKSFSESMERLTKHLNNSEESSRVLREQITVFRNKTEKLEQELAEVQSVLNRRSVKFVLALIHKLMLRG